MVLISKGTVHRERDENGQIHYVDLSRSHGLFGSFHLLRNDPMYATLRCETDVEIMSLTDSKLRRLIRKDPNLAEELIYGLCKEVRRQSNQLRTPLLEQKSKPSQVWATSIAATVESFYRSALNAILNQRLVSAVPKHTSFVSRFFPNMHIQIPTRIFYINGFKGLRIWFEKYINVDDYQYPDLVRLASALAPGIIMSPASSVLEACNAGHLNPEPLMKRWTRGYLPRGTREVIFGVGLNQLSDYCEERIPFITHSVLRNAFGSMIAGCIAGYLSHVPHNLSTLKLMYPNKSYSEHFANLVTQNMDSTAVNLFSAGRRKLVAKILTVVAPRGVMIRTCQIVGSFIILNGTINYLDLLQFQRPANPQEA
eukprot:TRINITY_DN7494_c0_g1_i1.p1 TRINITY_DN7494_c0_g1~~TRINITY_DN7494_c0_g1_i1.p1  ORF type:complete len:368 (+),score=28.27 TRINITY_DN7494_c0_g1_i1:109-1212(+)